MSKPNPLDEIGYCIEIPDTLHEKMTRHVKMLKKLEDRGYSKRRFAIEAIKEKLEKPPKETTKRHVLSIAFPKQMYKKVEQRTALIQAVRSYSKKKWILEAIYEKLDRGKERFARCEAESLEHAPDNAISNVAKKYACPAKSLFKKSKKKVHKW